MRRLRAMFSTLSRNRLIAVACLGSGWYPRGVRNQRQDALLICGVGRGDADRIAAPIRELILSLGILRDGGHDGLSRAEPLSWPSLVHRRSGRTFP